MGAFVLLLISLGFGFFSYLFYTRQVKWLFSVMRNAAVGTGGLLLFNFAFSGFGLAVGINAVTVLIVGLLGAPGVLLLYAAQMLVG